MVVHPYNKAQNSQGQKLFHKRFILETLKSTQSVNHRNNPFIAHDSYIENRKGGKSPHTPTLYPCIVLNVFNMYKMQRKSMKCTYLLKVEGMREKLSSSHPSSCSTYLDFH